LKNIRRIRIERKLGRKGADGVGGTAMGCEWWWGWVWVKGEVKRMKVRVRW